jgi:hypothetical protein
MKKLLLLGLLLSQQAIAEGYYYPVPTTFVPFDTGRVVPRVSFKDED